MRKNGILIAALAAVAAAAAAAFAFAVISCAGPVNGNPAGSSGEGRIRIGPLAGNGRTALPGASETITFKAVFQGPGGTITKEFPASGGTAALAAGSWNITVKAYNAEPRLRGMAEATMQITPGKTHDIKVRSAIGVKTVNDLDITLPGSVTAQYVDPATETLWVLEQDITLPVFLMVNTGRHVLIAEPGTTRTITRALDTSGGLPGIPGNLQIINPGTSVTLGMAGETGKLVIDGDRIDALGSGAMLYAHGGSHLVIDGNTEVTRALTTTNRGAAIWAHGNVTGRTVLELKGGKIHGNTSGEGGGAIDIMGASFIMSGGEISGNATTDPGGSSSNAGGGGAVLVEGGGDFEMRGGSITGNTAVNNDTTGLVEGGGGAVMLWSSDFEMSGGAITGNTALNNVGSNISGGGAVWLGGASTFTMSGGTISGNTADDRSSLNDGRGGGVFIGVIGSATGTFYMSGGTISNNTAKNSAGSGRGRGGGVYLGAGTSAGFDMSGGSITGNRTLGTPSGPGDEGGGGVYINAGNFTMSGGAITGNSATTRYGGGVYYYSSGPVNCNLPSDVLLRIHGNTNDGSADPANFYIPSNQTATMVGTDTWYTWTSTLSPPLPYPDGW